MSDVVGLSWRDTVLAKVEKQARATRNKHGHGRGARVQYMVSVDYLKAVDAAARVRGISRMGYMRRAVAAFVAADLGVEFESVVAGGAMPQPHESTGEVVVGIGRGANDDGAGYGTWQVPGGQTGG